MDLAQLSTTSRSEQGAFLHLNHPATGLPLFNDGEAPVGLVLRGMDSAIVLAKSRETTQKRIDGALAVGRRVRVDAAGVEADAVALLVVATKEVRGLTVAGVPVGNTPADFKKLYNDFTWVREQADAFISDRANFLGN